MGFYDRFILPGMVDRACRDPRLNQERNEIVAQASGRVLEVGFGSGLNLRYYSSDQVETLVGLDPSRELGKLVRNRARDLGFPFRLIHESAEAIPEEDGSFDSVVLTFTLCSIPDPQLALEEMRRVLKVGGSLYFVEHGKAPDLRVLKWQNRITPIWKHLSGGCHLNRDIKGLMAGAGFEMHGIHEHYAATPKFASWVTRGVGRKE